jgi:hypothetical protein
MIEDAVEGRLIKGELTVLEAIFMRHMQLLARQGVAVESPNLPGLVRVAMPFNDRVVVVVVVMMGARNREAHAVVVPVERLDSK